MKIVKESPYVCSYSPEVSIVECIWLLRFWTSLMAQRQRILPCRRLGSILAWERSPGEGNGNPVLLLGNPSDRGAWQATVHGVVQSWTRLSD